MDVKPVGDRDKSSPPGGRGRGGLQQQWILVQKHEITAYLLAVSTAWDLNRPVCCISRGSDDLARHIVLGYVSCE